MNDSPVDLQCSRPTSSAFSGKQEAVLKTLVTDEVLADFHRFARARGYPTASDCLREIVHVAMYGVDYMADLHRKRLASLAPNRSETSTDETA